MAQAARDENNVPTLLAASNVDGKTPVRVYADPTTHRLLVDIAGGSGTVTSFSFTDANGFDGTVTNPTTTPDLTLAITVSGMLKGVTGAITQAVANTDYQVPITLTTTGTSGAATFNGTTLNIPNYATGSGVVQSVVGTANRITVDSTDPANPIVNIAATYVGQTSITTLGTIATGTWNGTVVAGQYGGTGVANTGKTITLGGNLTTSGAFASTFTMTNTTSVTFPTTGTLATTADIANDVTAASTFGTDESILRSDGTGRGAQATSTNAVLTDAGAMTLASTATATGFIPTATTATGNRLYLPGTNTVGISTNGTGRVQWDTAAMSPITNDGFALGTTSLGWSDLFFATGAVINYANGNVVLTHSSGILTMGTGEFRITTPGTNSASVPTLGSTSTFTNKILSHTVEPATDDTYTGEDITGKNAGATIAQWEAVYLNSSGNWVLTDADAASTAGGVMMGLAAAAGTNGNPLTVVLRGIIRNDGWTWATVGAPLYLSTTAGAITDTAPSGTDDVIRVIGYVITDDCIYLNPSNDWITHT